MLIRSGALRSFLILLLSSPVMLGCVKKKDLNSLDGELTGGGTGSLTGSGSGTGSGTGSTTGVGTGDGSVTPGLPTLPTPDFRFPIPFPDLKSGFFQNPEDLGIRIVNETNNLVQLSGGVLRLSNPASGTPGIANFNYSLRDVYVGARVIEPGTIAGVIARHHVVRATFGDHCYTICYVDGNTSQVVMQQLIGTTVYGKQVISLPSRRGIIEFVNYQDTVACVYTAENGSSHFVGAMKDWRQLEPMYHWGVYMKGNAQMGPMAAADLRVVSNRNPIPVYRTNFDNSPTLNDVALTQRWGSANVFADALVSTGGQSTPAVLTIRNTMNLRTAEVSANVRATEPGAEAGLILRYQVGGGFYAAELANRGSFTQVRIAYYSHPSSLSPTILAAETLRGTEEHLQVNLNGPLRLSARAQGSDVILHLNGQYITAAQIGITPGMPNLQEGGFGVRIVNPSNNTVSAGIDNLEMTATNR